jgi:hypothetical protein
MSSVISRDTTGFAKYKGPAKKWLLDREPYYLETNSPGVFADGDVRHGL